MGSMSVNGAPLQFGLDVSESGQIKLKFPATTDGLPPLSQVRSNDALLIHVNSTKNTYHRIAF